MPAPADHRHTTTAWSDRKKFWVAVAVVFGAIIVTAGAAAIAHDRFEPPPAQRAETHQEAVQQPSSLERPDYGRKPEHPGDPGGWEQLALLGLLIVALGGGTALVVRSSRRARRSRRLPTGPTEAPPEPRAPAGRT